MPEFNRKSMSQTVGRMPALQFLKPSELSIESDYQRSIEGLESQKLIRLIAQNWNWDLCQPLAVSQRDGHLFVIDGQHRLAAAKLRGDIEQLPCVVGLYGSVKAEAVAFTNLNDRRRPLSALDKFKAAVVAGEPDAIAISAALAENGLSLARHTNWKFWKPGQVGNVGGLRQAWKKKGAEVSKAALGVLAEAYGEEVLRYAGMLFPGLVSLCEDGREKAIAEDQIAKLTKTVKARDQAAWYSITLEVYAKSPDLGRHVALTRVLRAAMKGDKDLDRLRKRDASRPVLVRPAPAARPEAVKSGMGLDKHDAVASGLKQHCEQCDRLRSPADVKICTSNWCKLRDAA